MISCRCFAGHHFLDDTKNHQSGQCETLSSKTRNMIDVEVRSMLDDAYFRARQLLVSCMLQHLVINKFQIQAC